MTDMPERIRMRRDYIKGFKKAMFGGTEYIRIDKYEELEAENAARHKANQYHIEKRMEQAGKIRDLQNQIRNHIG